MDACPPRRCQNGSEARPALAVWPRHKGFSSSAAAVKTGQRHVQRSAQVEYRKGTGRGIPMCGRFTLRSSGESVAEAFDLPEVPDLLPRFNIAPGQPVAVVREMSQAQDRQLAYLRWGLIPAWADDLSIGDRLANARSETATTKPSFRRAFRSRRCLVVADGFYEWQKING